MKVPEEMWREAANFVLDTEGKIDDSLKDVAISFACGTLTSDEFDQARRWFNGLHLTDSDVIDSAESLARGVSIETINVAKSFFKDETMNDVMVQRDTDNLVRQVDFRAKASDGLTLDGYGAVFNEWTDISDFAGEYRERILPGAFKRTIGMRTPVLQFDHGAHPLIGSIPLGRITSISEDAHGLRVKAKLSDNWLVEPVRDAIRDGGVTGMSFRFRVVDEEWSRGKDGVDERSISEIELYEVGPVVFPAYEQTTVGVRSREALQALTDPDIRSEIARILTNGTDVSSLADSDTSDDIHVSDSDAPAVSHARTVNQRKAVAFLSHHKD